MCLISTLDTVNLRWGTQGKPPHEPLPKSSLQKQSKVVTVEQLVAAISLSAHFPSKENQLLEQTSNSASCTPPAIVKILLWPQAIDKILLWPQISFT
jgi:hypothetical protein